MSETVPSPLLPRDEFAPADAFAVDRAAAPFRQALRWLSLALVAIMIVLPALQVVLREFLNLPFVGAEELTRFTLICVVFLTLPYVVVSGANIRLEEGLRFLPARPQRFTRIVIATTAAISFAIAATSVGVATMRNLQNATPTLGIPYWIFFSASLIGFLGAALESALQAYKTVTGRPPFIAFADEAAPDDMDALEAALVAEADRGAGGERS
jgi:TRAP-type C4-dicarboxylate transport system permease small subunit